MQKVGEAAQEPEGRDNGSFGDTACSSVTVLQLITPVLTP